MESTKKSKFKVGDAVYFQCCDVLNIKGFAVVISIRSGKIEFPYRIRIDQGEEWYVEESELRSLTKLERALR